MTDDKCTSQFGVTVVARTFEDGIAVDIARRIHITPEHPELFDAGAAGTKSSAPKVPWPVTAGATVGPLVVVGAHRKGQPLVAELERRGAFWDGPVTTAPLYRMVALDSTPPKPGVVRSKQGAELVGERWLLSEAALGSFLSQLPEPMLLGSITLSDGSKAVGFACDAEAAASGRDITEYRDWITALRAFDQHVEEVGPATKTGARFWREVGQALITGLQRGQK